MTPEHYTTESQGTLSTKPPMEPLNSRTADNCDPKESESHDCHCHNCHYITMKKGDVHKSLASAFSTNASW